MEEQRKQLATGILLGAVAALLGLMLVLIGIAYSGAYDVSASRGHTAGMRWLLDTTMHSSIRARAGDAGSAPAAGADLANGAGEFKAMCEHCHGGPGVDPQPWSRGMLPQPPQLTEEAAEWQASELLWIVDNGIKYTGMPAFGPTHDEATLRDIVAFVQRLPGMTPEQYAASGPALHHGKARPRGEPGREDEGHQH